jgi:phosphate uptake regulator
LINFGKGSYILSLPKDWVIRNKLKKGSVLSLEVNGQSLMISTDLVEKEIEKKALVINADNKALEEVHTEIVAAYLAGYTLIEVVSHKLKEKGESIKERIASLAGLEILEQTATKITAKYLINTKEISLDSMIRRMDNITKSLIIDAMECIDGCNNHSSIQQRDNDVNRLNFLIIRTVREIISSNKQLSDAHKTSWQLFTYLGIAERLEKVSDRQKRIARGLEQLKLSPGFSSELLLVYTSIKESFIEVMKAYYQHDKNLAMKIEMGNRERIYLCNRLLGRSAKREYSLVRKPKKDIPDTSAAVHEYIIMTEIINNLKAMAASVKMIARIVMNNEE